MWICMVILFYTSDFKVIIVKVWIYIGKKVKSEDAGGGHSVSEL